VNAKLAEALDHAFAESESGPRRFTKAVVVLHRGRIVGERYATGVTPATPLIGWSMTKSVTNALLGILVGNGKLDMYEPVPIDEWSTPGDPRRRITPDQLLRMASGIGCGQSLHTAGFKTLFDSDTHMEYDMADQSAFAANASLRAKPGSEWRYTNCNFVLLSRIIRNLAGGDANAARKFVARELFEPLGFEHATFEYDSAGVPLGTIHQSINEHDFEYGTGFWTLRGNSAAARARIAAGMPSDSFMAIGAQGQYTIVMPSQDLVIVRIGWAYTPNDDRVAVERLVRDTIAALQSEK
jgi:CubicO group peptidase (beta-lactamase class C family)